MSNAILKNAIQTRSRFLLWQHTTAFFLSFLNFVGSWLLLLLLYNKEGRSSFFFPKSFCPSFLSFFFGASFTHKKSPFIRYTIIVYETRADIYIFMRNACVPLKQNKFS